MFDYCYSLTSLNLTNWQPANATSYSAMFRCCYDLTTIGNISNWDTSKCTNFSSMFENCHSLTSIPNINNWDMTKATTVASMFAGMVSIAELTINNLQLDACTTIATMFRYCYNLKKVTFLNWNLPKLTTTSPAAFLGDCWALQDVNINLNIPLNHSYNSDWSLTHDSLINILNSLPTVSTTRTLN